jgi:hypothetical protein
VRILAELQSIRAVLQRVTILRERGSGGDDDDDAGVLEFDAVLTGK